MRYCAKFRGKKTSIPGLYGLQFTGGLPKPQGMIDVAFQTKEFELNLKWLSFILKRNFELQTEKSA